MERLYHETKQVGEIFDIGQVNPQLKELLTSISEGKEIKKEKFSQISPEVLSFLQEKAQLLEENELRYILLALLIEPKPEKQRNIIKIIDEFITKNKKETKKKIDQEKLEAKIGIKKFIYINESLEKTREEGFWNSLLSFYSNPENQKIRPEILEEALEEARKNRYWSSLLSFYSNPENQKIRSEILEEALEEARKNRYWDPLLSFYSNPDNQKIRPEILEEALEEARKNRYWDPLLSFYSNPENQKIRPEILEEIFESCLYNAETGLSSYDLNLLLSFYSNPKNQYKRDKILDKAFKLATIGEHYDSLLSFYSNPENQKIRPEILEEALK
jgi:hypothetical protein